MAVFAGFQGLFLAAAVWAKRTAKQIVSFSTVFHLTLWSSPSASAGAIDPAKRHYARQNIAADLRIVVLLQ